jgi:branched-chain amino acid transport system permease protein
MSLEYFIEFSIVYVLLSWAVYLPIRAGLLFAGPVYSMAVGGYFAAYVVCEQGWPLVAGLVGAVVVGGAFGFIPALGLARTTGITTGMASIALVYIMQAILRNLSFLGGSSGFRITHHPVEANALSYVCVVLVGLFLYRLERSRTGRALEAALADRDLAFSAGINVTRVSVFALTASCAIGAIAGVIFVFNLGRIYPDSFGFTLCLYMNTMVFVGGRYTMWGPLVAAPVLFGLPFWLPHALASYANIVYGALLVAVLVLRPQGAITRALLDRVVRAVRFRGS